VSEKEIEAFIQRLKDYGLMYFDPLERRVRVFKHSLNRPRKDEITITVAYGYGLNEVFQNYTIKIDELNDFVDKFDPPEDIPKIKNGVSTIVDIKTTKVYNNNFKITLYMSEPAENNLSELRNHLFESLRKISTGAMKHEDAKAVASLSQTVINSIKVELEYKMFAKKQPEIKMLEST